MTKKSPKVSKSTGLESPEIIEWVEQTVNVSQLKPYERNPRKISKEAFSRLVDNIKRNGYHQRILATADLRVIGGHQRIKALEAIGMTTVKVLTPDRAVSEAQFRELLIKDNLPFGEFDNEMLAADFTPEELLEWGMPEAWLPAPCETTEGLTDEDAVPEAPVVPITVPGDIWLLGNHRLMCGSSTDADAVNTLLAGVQPMLMVTDPPYGVDYDANWRNEADRANGKPYGARAIGKVSNDLNADWSEAWALFPGEVAYVWHAGVFSPLVAESLAACDFEIRSQIIWAKSNFAIGRGHYHWKHEPCWYAVKKGGTGHWQGDRKQTTLWDIDKPQKSETGHSTQKPVECMRRPIENNSKNGDWVYEPFSGSGTTIIAGETTGRKVLAMELNPAYVDMAIKRWQDFTGKEATHAQSGERFNSGIRLPSAQKTNARRVAAGKRSK